jgi:hypothetical protein
MPPPSEIRSIRGPGPRRANSSAVQGGPVPRQRGAWAAEEGREGGRSRTGRVLRTGRGPPRFACSLALSLLPLSSAPAPEKTHHKTGWPARRTCRAAPRRWGTWGSCLRGASSSFWVVALLSGGGRGGSLSRHPSHVRERARHQPGGCYGPSAEGLLCAMQRAGGLDCACGRRRRRRRQGVVRSKEWRQLRGVRARAFERSRSRFDAAPAPGACASCHE